MSESLLTLASIAILKVDIDTRYRDYLSYLTPFVMAALQGRTQCVITDSDVRTELLAEFGLAIPASVVQLILRRLVRKGYLTKSYGVFYISATMPPSELDHKRQQARAKIANVITGLVQYAKEKYRLDVAEAAASDALLSLFRQFGVHYLAAFIQESAIPQVPQASEGLQLATCSFIADLHKRGDSQFQELVVMLKGVLLSNALLCSDLESIQRNFKQVVFYLDSPILLSLLGLHGLRQYALARDMVDLLRRLKGTVAYFAHTLEETRHVIQSAIEYYEATEYQMKIVEECRKRGLKMSDIILVLNKVEDMLESLGLARRSTPKEMADYMVIDQSQLEMAVSDEITYMNPRALEYDVESIRAIYVLRKGRNPRQLEDCGAVFVTSNSGLVKASAMYAREHETSEGLAPAITDFNLTNIAWLKAPMGAPELPETELLAICYAGLEPKADLWNRYVREINDLKVTGKLSSDDHAILRSSELARTELVNVSIGYDLGFGAETINEVLKRVKESLVAEASGRLDREREEHDATRAERESLEEQQKDAMKSIYWSARRDSEILSRGVFWLVLVLLGAGSFVGAPVHALLRHDYGLMSRLLQALVVVAMLFGVANWLIGSSVRGLCSELQRWVETWLFRKRYKAIFGSEVESVPGGR